MPTPAGSKSAWWPIAIRRVTFSARSQGNDGLCPLGAIHGPPEDQLSYFWIFVDVCNGTFTFALKAVRGGTERGREEALARRRQLRRGQTYRTTMALWGSSICLWRHHLCVAEHSTRVSVAGELNARFQQISGRLQLSRKFQDTKARWLLDRCYPHVRWLRGLALERGDRVQAASR